MSIPVEVEELTAEWFTQIVQSRAPGAAVDAVEVIDTSSGTTGRARVGLTSTDERIPSTVFVKLPPFTPDRRAMVNMTGMGVSEARFYEDVAPWLPVRTPSLWHAAHDLETDGYIMVFDDLAAVGATQPTQEEADALDFASQVMETFARFHAAMNGSDRVGPGGDLQWIGERTHNYGSPEGDAILRMGIQAFGDEMPPVFHEMAELYFAHGLELNDVLFEGTQTLIHGDCHIGNMLRDADGPILLDWAMVGARPRAARRRLLHRQLHPPRGAPAPRAGPAAHLPRRPRRPRRRHRMGRGVGHLPPPDHHRLVAASMTAAMGDTLQPLEIGMRATERSNLALEELEVLPLLRKKLG